MPRNDGTGPFGDGRPGRGLGPCGRFGRGNRAAYGPGRGFGQGRRNRRGGWLSQFFGGRNRNVTEYDEYYDDRRTRR